MEIQIRFRKGIVYPADRIVIYKRLLKLIKECMKEGDVCFMCNLMQTHISDDLYDCWGYIKALPELAQQRPIRLLPNQSAWYSPFEYGVRIKNVNDAIKLWEKKFKKK